MTKLVFMQNDQSSTPATPNYTDPNNPSRFEAPPDPSNTSHIGQKVEQGVVSKNEGISEQSGTWEDKQESNVPDRSLLNPDAEKYIRDPSPEEANNDNDENQDQ
jgi:hypothetical protein